MKKTKQEIALVKDQMKLRYLFDDYNTEKELSEEYGVAYNTLRTWILRGDNPWRKEKRERALELKEQAARLAIKELSSAYKVSGKALSIVSEKIIECIQLGLYEPKELPKIFASLASGIKQAHSVLRLEGGQSTTNHAIHSGSIDEVVSEEAIRGYEEDPFRSHRVVNIEVNNEES